MKRLRKRMLSILLVLAMAFSLMPISAIAAGATAPTEIPEWIQEKINSIPENEQYNKPGWQEITGSDLFYYPLMRSEIVDGHMVTDTIVFIAPGENANAADSSIPNYKSMEDSPWGESTVSAVYIADGVTGVGNYAFDNMTTLTTLEIEDPTDLTTIGEYAFRGCDKLAFSEENPLSLPNLESLGQYAFSGCERLGYVELGGTLTEIPQYAFNYAGLRDIEIPASVTSIGDYAFANNNFSNADELVLPGGLETIGKYAFYRNLATGDTSGFTSITIPSTVTTIGDYAFYNHRRLETVTVDATAANGFTQPGHAAFGTAPTDGSYSETVDITVDNITYENVSTGTQFLTQDKATAGLFVSGENCFLGNLEPLEFEYTQPATCTEDGYDRYTLTIKNVTTDGEPVTMNVDFPIEKLGHNYVRQEDTLPATCTYPERYEYLCMNVVNGLVKEEDCERPRYTENAPDGQPALGHNYQVDATENLSISKESAGDAKITYTCNHYSTEADKNLHDGPYAASYTWTIARQTLTASTSHTLGELTLPTPQGQGNTISAKLEWATEDTDTLLEAGTRSYPVKLAIDRDTFPEYTNDEFTIEVQVDKIKLDFSNVAFENATRYTGQNNAAFAVTGLPEGIIEDSIKIEYSRKNDNNWSTNKPAEATANDAAEYDVRVTFSYEGDKYLLVTSDPELQPSAGYTLAEGTELNTATITGAYTVRALTKDDLKVSTVPNLTYQKDTPQKVIRVEGVPVGSKVTATWEEGSETKTEAIESTTVTAFTIAGITDAGKYPVTIKVENEDAIEGGSVTLGTVEGTIAKQTVTTPTANALDQYTPGVTQTGVSASTDASVYTVKGNTATDAGTHTAIATLVDNKNYKWFTGDNDGNGVVDITYTIPKRAVTAPTLSQDIYTYEKGTVREPLTGVNSALTVTYDEEGTLIATYTVDGVSEIVFTATDARRTDAGKYTATVSLNNGDKQNYQWARGGTEDIKLSWEIMPKSIAAPTVTVNNATYTANPYNAATNITCGQHELLSLGSNHTYYTSSGLGDKPLNYVPTNAGSYKVEIDFVFPTGEKESNYDITGTTRYEFEITKAPLIVNNPSKTEYTYTGAAQAIEGVTVSGLISPDTEAAYNLTYTSKKWDATLNNNQGGWSDDFTTHSDGIQLEDVGKYQITPVINSNNYTAEITPYEVEIKAAGQTIQLTPDTDSAEDWNAGSNTMTKTLGVAPFSVIGQGYVGQYKTNATITYESSDSTTASVDGNGEVTLHKATGETPVTITVKAAADDNGNYGAAEETYTLTVNKATPTIDVSEYTDGKFDTQYTGSAITDYEKATLTGAGNGAVEPTGTLVYTFYADGACEEKLDNGNGTDSNIPIAVGTYYLKITYGGDDNYTSAEAGPITVNVTKAEVGDVTVADYTGTYDGKSHNLKDQQVSVEGFEATQYTVKYAQSATQPAANAGHNVWKEDITVKNVSDSTSETTKYWYMVTIDGGNYAPKIGEIQVTITPAELTVGGVLTSFTKAYDSTDTVTEELNGITVTGVGEDEIVVSNPTGKYETEDAGSKLNVTINLTLSGITEWGNYKYNDTALTEGKLTVTKTDAGEITQKEITVTGISATDRVYDGTETVTLTGTPTTTGQIDGDNLTLTLAQNATGTVQNSSQNANDAANVGEDKGVLVEDSVIDLTGTDADNYTVVGVKYTADTGITVNITKRPVTLEFVGIDGEQRVITKPYTGQPVNVTVTAIENQGGNAGFVGNDSLKAEDVAYTYTPVSPTTDAEHTAVGDYTVTAALQEDSTQGNYSNYELKFPEAATLRITNTTGVKVEAEDYTGAYTGQAHDVTDGWGFTGYVESTAKTVYFIKKDDTHTTAPEASSSEWQTITFKDVSQSGEYWWKVSADSHEDVVGTDTVKITITPLDLEINTSLSGNGTKEYDGDATVDETITGTVSGTVKGETITATAETASYDKADAGDRTITISYTLSGADLSNYTYGGNAIPDNGQIEVTEEGKITPKEITVTILNKEKVYDGEAPVAGSTQTTDWTVEEGAIVNNDNLGVTLTVEESEAAVDTYHITGKVNNSNYDVTFAGEDSQNNYGVYTVTARPISVQIGDASGIYGDAPDMSCGENKIELTDTTDDGNGIVADENIYTVLTGLTLTTTADNTSDVGSNYTISAKSGNNQYGNYQVTFTNGTYTVKQRPVTITIADKSSAYGCELERLTSSDAYTGDANKDGIVNEDNLGIQLTTTASASANVGSYPISGKADNEVVAANYAITWVGENGGWSESDQSTADPTKATYTITKAGLTIAFPNESVNVSMGGTTDNPLGFTNTSSEEELSAKPADVQVKYESNNTDVATVNETTGAVTIVGTGDATITATVTNGGQNFEASSTDSYVIHVAGASTGIQVQAVPNTGLTYNGAMQELLEGYTVSPQTAEVTFEVKAQTEGDQCEINEDGMPTAQDAGTYRVSWTAKQSGYADVTGWVDVTIAKAEPSTGFSNKTVQTEYAEHKLYDSTQYTQLNQADDYEGNITYLSNNTQVAKVTENNLQKIQIFGTGDATISAQFAETDNFNAQTVSFTLTVTVAGTKIDYTVSDYEVTYNGQPHGADITVNNPSTYTIMYSNNQGTSYELTDSPVITDVKDGPLTIYFQIQADGYASVTGTQTVTVTPKEITEDMVSGIAESYTYTGKQITPESELVMDGNTRLTKGTDYTVSYGTNITVGPGSDETLTDGGGWVKITGTGNYSGAVTKYFAITAVDSGSLTAALDRYYGFYNDEETNHATVQVHHNISGQTGHDVDTREITVTVAEGPENGAKINGTTVTFTQVGTYKLAVEVTGTHSGSFTLLYALLPATSGDGLILTVDGEDTPAVSTYGEKVNGNISVTSDGTALNADAYTLTYSYQPFAGDGAVSAGTPYDAAEVFGDDIPAAGLYVITATAKEGSGYTGTGTFVFLVQQKHLEDSMITEIAAETYTGSAQQPEPKVSYSPNGEELLSAADYTVSHHDNVNAGEALAIVTANKDSNNFTGSARKAFTINPKPITDETVTIAEIEDQYYTGNPVVPDLTITDGGYTLVLNHDYEVTCADQGPGQATVTITGIGNYTNQTEKTFTIIAESEPQPTDQFTLTVEPDAEWTYGSAPEDLEIQVKFGDTGLTLGEDYTLTVNGVTYDGTEDMSLNDAVASLKALKPGQYKVTAQGIGDAFSKSSDTAGIQVFKVKPTVTVTATPGTLSGSGEVTLTLTGSNLPAGTDLTRLLTATRNGTTLDLSSLNWTQQGNVWTAKLALPNADATYIFTLAFAETDTHAAASDTATVVTAKHTNSGGTVDPDPEPEPEPEPDPAPTDPDDTGVSDWLDTDNHKVYLNGYPDDSFQPEKDMTRAEAAQMFYNLLRDQDVETTVSFTDVAADAWYATAVNALASLEIVNGVGDDRFSPERTITRAEFTTMAMRFCDEIPDGENIFSDVDQEDWFYEYVVGSIQYGWINGYPDGTFRPNDTISRAEVTTITNRMLGRAADEAFVDQHQDSLRIFTDLKDTHWAYYQIVEATNAHEYTKDNGTEDWTKLV